MKIAYILTLMLFFSLFASAQNEEDAIRFSRISPFGTARSAAMGGAFGALGGDLSTLSTNPGGIGVLENQRLVSHPCLTLLMQKQESLTMKKICIYWEI